MPQVLSKLIEQVTPIESREGILFKRDDYFRPFASPMNGTKLRQCIALCEKNAEKARRGIVTGTSILSPQGAIVASVAHHLNAPCAIYYGGTTAESLKKHKYPTIALQQGAHVIIGSRSGRTAVVNKMAREKAEQDNALLIKYGMDFSNNLDCFVNSVARQVGNFPDQLDSVVAVVGSGITLIGLMFGMAVYGKSVADIYGVGCAPNRLEKIRNYADAIRNETGVVLPLDKLRYVDAHGFFKGFKYEQEHHVEFAGIKFHPRYEAKAANWMLNYLHPKRDNKTLFFINGQDVI